MTLAEDNFKKSANVKNNKLFFLAGDIFKPFLFDPNGARITPSTDPSTLPPPPPMTTLPDSHASYKPIGVGDLPVVKQQLLRYEAGEISNIQNILKGETIERTVYRSESVETTTTTETENIKEEERDQQSTDRFELQNQTQNVIQKIPPKLPVQLLLMLTAALWNQ